MNAIWLPGSATLVAEVLGEMFREHGIESFRDGDVLRFPAHPEMWANGAATLRQFPKVLQLDVRLGLEGRKLIESVTGFGTEDEPAIRDGMKAFQRATLPVLLNAFFNRPNLVNRQHWDIAGQKRLVFIGEVTSRFGFPRNEEGKPDIRFFPEFQRLLEAQPLTPGTHWIRLYQMRMNGKVLANEVLLDNVVWPEMQDKMAAFDWPPSDDKTYDVRVFLVIRD